MSDFDIKTATECPKCGLEAKTLLHRFCTHAACPVREGLKELAPGLQAIVEANRHIRESRAGIYERKPRLGPPKDTAVSRVLLAERPDFDPVEADRLAVKIVDALDALANADTSDRQTEPREDQ